METIYKEGNIFVSKNQKSFKVKATGIHNDIYFEAVKLKDKNGMAIIPVYKNYYKNCFKLLTN